MKRNVFSKTAQMLVLCDLTTVLSAQGPDSVTAQIKVQQAAVHAQPGHWAKAVPGQYLFGAEAKRVFVLESDPQHPGAVLRSSHSWVALRPGDQIQQKTFLTQWQARRWVEEGGR